MTRVIARLIRDEAGLTAIEYSLFTALLSIAAVSLFSHH